MQNEAVQALADSLRAGVAPVALRGPTCAAWQLDVGAPAVQPARGRKCPMCGNNFRTSFPTVSNLLSLLRPTLQ